MKTCTLYNELFVFLTIFSSHKPLNCLNFLLVKRLAFPRNARHIPPAVKKSKEMAFNFKYLQFLSIGIQICYMI